MFAKTALQVVFLLAIPNTIRGLVSRGVRPHLQEPALVSRSSYEVWLRAPNRRSVVCSGLLQGCQPKSDAGSIAEQTGKQMMPQTSFREGRIQKFGLVIVCVSTLASGCVQNDPEYQEQKAERIAQVSKTNLALSAREFDPLVPICLRALERNELVSDAEMTSLGFSRTAGFGVGQAYVKKRGAKIRGSRTQFTVSAKSCFFTLGNFSGVNEGAATLRRLLEENGYKDRGKARKGRAFEKSSARVFLGGYFYSSYSQFSIEK